MYYEVQEAIDKNIKVMKAKRFAYFTAPFLFPGMLIAFNFFTHSKDFSHVILIFLAIASFSGYMYIRDAKAVKYLSEEPEIKEIQGFLKKGADKKGDRYYIGESDTVYREGAEDCEEYEGQIVCATVEVKSGIILLIRTAKDAVN